MKNLILLIALGTMLTACVTRNPTRAKNQIADMVELNPSLANFQSDTLIQSTTKRTVVNIPGDIRNREVRDKVETELQGLSDKDKKTAFKKIRKSQKNGKGSTTYIGDKTLIVENKGNGVKAIVETPVEGLVVNKYTIEVPEKEVKKKPWTISKIFNTAVAILAIGGALVALRWFFLFMKRNDKKV